MAESRERPLTIAIAAIGGQGGGVLTGWLVETAKANGYLAQSTFVAGVAQRTGATVYCVEIFPQDRAKEIGADPVFTAYPVPGDVDLVVAGEMAETGRAIQKGFVTPNVTTLVASSHRVYSIDEKSAMGDGIVDQGPVVEIANKAAKQFVSFDMQAVADETGSVISSVLLGAIAATGALPFARDAFEDSIRQAGRAVDANLEGFARGFEQALAQGDATATRAAPSDGKAAVTSANDVDVAAIVPATPRGPNGEALARRIAESLPDDVGAVALHGALRALDFQDVAYANTYLDRLDDMLKFDEAADGAAKQYALTREVARQLALQMSYEDTIRVADLKTRGERHRRIREHVAAAPDQPMYVGEYFQPRVEEICDTMPAWLGDYILNSNSLRRGMKFAFSRGRVVKTTKIGGFLMLHMLAKMRRFRRSTLRYRNQHRLIDDWLDCVRTAVEEDYDYALSLAKCIEIVKGYGDTYQRGLTRYRTTVDTVRQSPSADRAAAVRRLHNAALADEPGRVFEDAITAMEATS